MIGISRLINGNECLKETCQVCEIFIAKIVPMFHKMYLGADSKGVRFWTPRPEYIRPWQPLDMPLVCFFPSFVCGFCFMNIHNSQDSRERGRVSI